MKRIAALISALLASPTVAQQPAAAPQLSPQAAYDLASRPLEITRASIANWSDTEVESLAIALKNAGQACDERPTATIDGEDLIALARLCSFGQRWDATGDAALRYIDSNDPAKPQLGLAYAFNLAAKVHSGRVPAIVIAAQSLLNAVPYDATSDATFNDALRYLHLAYTYDALGLFATREPRILAALKSAAVPGSKPLLPRHALYEDGLAYAALQQYVGEPQEAAATVAALDLALINPALDDPANGRPLPLPPDESIPIADARHRYALIGQPLPRINSVLSLFDIHETPRIDENFGNATAFFLFPEWCAQCVRMANDLSPALQRFNEKQVHLYALLAAPLPDMTTLQPPPPPKPTHRGAKPLPAPLPDPKPVRKTPAQLLLHTPTLLVPPETLKTFVATDFPALIVTDHAGIIRYLGIAPEASLEPNNILDQITNHIAQTWKKK